MNEHTHEHGHAVPTQQITVQKRTFTAPSPYKVGHVLNEIEAVVMNQTYGENLRNNFSARMKKAASKGITLTQDDFWKYAEKYAFGVRQPRQNDRNPVDVQERKLAVAAVRKAIKDKGINVKDVAPDTFAAYVEQTIAAGTFRAQAEALCHAPKLDIRIAA